MTTERIHWRVCDLMDSSERLDVEWLEESKLELWTNLYFLVWKVE